MKSKKGQTVPTETLTLRGSIEVVLKNAFTGEEILHGKGDNVVLYSGRSWAMQKALTTANGTMTNNVVVGTGSTATAYTHTGPQAYFTYKTGTLNNTTQSGGTNVPYMQMLASWESTELNNVGFNSIWEFLLNNSTGSAGTYLCRYLSNTFINATTSNQLLITYTVSW